MSDPVAIAIIAAVGSAVHVLGLAWLNRKQKERLSDVHAAITETKEAMVVLEKNTNSIKDALVESTGKEQRAAGKLEGRAEADAESKEGKP